MRLSPIIPGLAGTGFDTMGYRLNGSTVKNERQDMEVCITDGGRTAAGFKETRDCTVRATAACLGWTYEQAHARLAELGRKPKHGMRFWTVIDDLGLEQRPDLSCRTIEKILPEMQQGRFIVRVHRHVFAVVDGVVHDGMAPKAKARAKMVYQFSQENH